jgi:hypothetical protein
MHTNVHLNKCSTLTCQREIDQLGRLKLKHTNKAQSKELLQKVHSPDFYNSPFWHASYVYLKIIIKNLNTFYDKMKSCNINNKSSWVKLQNILGSSWLYLNSYVCSIPIPWFIRNRCQAFHLFKYYNVQTLSPLHTITGIYKEFTRGLIGQPNYISIFTNLYKLQLASVYYYLSYWHPCKALRAQYLRFTFYA